MGDVMLLDHFLGACLEVARLCNLVEGVESGLSPTCATLDDHKNATTSLKLICSGSVALVHIIV
jgi:hypothetical protein